MIICLSDQCLCCFCVSLTYDSSYCDDTGFCYHDRNVLNGTKAKLERRLEYQTTVNGGLRNELAAVHKKLAAETATKEALREDLEARNQELAVEKVTTEGQRNELEALRKELAVEKATKEALLKDVEAGRQATAAGATTSRRLLALVIRYFRAGQRMEKRVQQQEGLIQQQAATITQQQATIAQQATTIVQQSATTARLASDLDAQDATIAAQGATIEAKDTTITARASELQQLRATVAAQRVTIESQEAALEEADKNVRRWATLFVGANRRAFRMEHTVVAMYARLVMNRWWWSYRDSHRICIPKISHRNTLMWALWQDAKDVLSRLATKAERKFDAVTTGTTAQRLKTELKESYQHGQLGQLATQTQAVSGMLLTGGVIVTTQVVAASGYLLAAGMENFADRVYPLIAPAVDFVVSGLIELLWKVIEFAVEVLLYIMTGIAKAGRSCFPDAFPLLPRGPTRYIPGTFLPLQQCLASDAPSTTARAQPPQPKQPPAVATTRRGAPTGAKPAQPPAAPADEHDHKKLRTRGRRQQQQQQPSERAAGERVITDRAGRPLMEIAPVGEEKEEEPQQAAVQPEARVAPKAEAPIQPELEQPAAQAEPAVEPETPAPLEHEEAVEAQQPEPTIEPKARAAEPQCSLEEGPMVDYRGATTTSADAAAPVPAAEPAVEPEAPAPLEPQCGVEEGPAVDCRGATTTSADAAAPPVVEPEAQPETAVEPVAEAPVQPEPQCGLEEGPTVDYRGAICTRAHAAPAAADAPMQPEPQQPEAQPEPAVEAEADASMQPLEYQQQPPPPPPPPQQQHRHQAQQRHQQPPPPPPP